MQTLLWQTQKRAWRDFSGAALRPMEWRLPPYETYPRLAAQRQLSKKPLVPPPEFYFPEQPENRNIPPQPACF